MALQKALFTLVEKRQLTNDVFELIFTAPTTGETKAGEYILFTLTDSTGDIVKRAYSIAYAKDGKFIFVIKRVEGGKGSPLICDANVGTQFEAMGPMGHFTLRQTEVPKCFIGTGTGFAPLYFQLRRSSEMFSHIHAHFVFGVREEKDMFYDKEISDLQSALPNLSVSYYLSRADKEGTHRGYVTDFLTTENIANFEEFYICGSPVMVKDTREKLAALGIPKEKIFFEQF